MMKLLRIIAAVPKRNPYRPVSAPKAGCGFICVIACQCLPTRQFSVCSSGSTEGR